MAPSRQGFAWTLRARPTLSPLPYATATPDSAPTLDLSKPHIIYIYIYIFFLFKYIYIIANILLGGEKKNIYIYIYRACI